MNADTLSLRSGRMALRNPDLVWPHEKAPTDLTAPFRMGDDLRVYTPIADASPSTAVQRYLRSMPIERRADLEANWADGERAADRTISAEIKARAAAEWRTLEARESLSQGVR